MLRRLTPFAAAVTVLSVAGSAGAAPRYCRLVTDPKGDGVATVHQAPPAVDDAADDGDLDILSADVASNRTHVTAVIRLATLRGATSPDSPTGRAWDLSFVVAEQRYIVHAAAGPEGYGGIVYRVTFEEDHGDFGAYTGEGIGSATVTLDTKAREVRITAPLSHFASWTPITPDRRLGGLRAITYTYAGTGGRVSYRVPNTDYGAYVGGGGAGRSVDVALSKKTYQVGAASCVAVGR